MLTSFGQNPQTANTTTYGPTQELSPGTLIMYRDTPCVVVKMSDLRKSNEKHIRSVQYKELSDSLKHEVDIRNVAIDMHVRMYNELDKNYIDAKSVGANWKLLYDKEYKKSQALAKKVGRRGTIICVIGGVALAETLILIFH